MNVQSVLPRDAIPSIDDPTFGSDYFGSDDDDVLVVAGRAYPIRVISSHEIVNVGGDRPLAVTWCPICWSGAVYDRCVEGQTLTFGVSGKLADDGLVMYDRETDSEWHQPTGRAIAGPLSGARLDTVPAPIWTVERFREQHPDGQFLQPVRGGPEVTDERLRAVHDMSRYRAYADGESFGLYGMRGAGEPRTWDRTDLDSKTLVAGVERDGESVGYPLPTVEAAGGVVTDRVGDSPIVVCAVDGTLHVYEWLGDPAEPVRDGRFRADGTVWDGATGTAADGRHLDRLPATTMFAFAWQDAHGPGAFYGRS